MFRHKKRKDATGTAIFGVFDGLVSVIGVIVGLLAGPSKAIVSAAVGLAVASAASMGFGEWLGDTSRSWRRALLMGAATLAGTLLPIIPFILFAKTIATIVAAVLALGAAGYIAEQRSATESRWKAYLETYAILLASVALTVFVTFLTGAG